MKKLTKLLLAIAVFVLLASTAIATVIVSGDVVYNGQLSRAKEYLEIVDTKTGERAFEKLTALESVNTYLTKTPVDPATEGYDAFVADYNAKIVEVLTELSTRTESFDDKLVKADYYLQIYSTVAVLSANTTICQTNSEAYKASVDLVVSGGYEIAKYYIETATTSYKATLDAAYANYLGDPENPAVISALDSAYEPVATTLLNLRRFTTYCPDFWRAQVSAKEGYAKLYNDMIALETAELWAMVADYNNTEKRSTQPKLAHTAYNAAADRLEAAVARASVDLSSNANRSLLEAINVVRADIAEKNRAKRIEVDNRANINEFEYVGNSFSYTMSDNKMPWGWSNTDATQGSYGEIKTDADGNKYMALHYGTYTGSYMNMATTDSSSGYVIEYDIGTEYDSEIKSIWVYSYDADKNGSKGAMGYYGIQNGVFYMPAAKGGSVDWNTPLTDKVITPGTSTHVAIAFNADTWTVEVFVDYQSIGTTNVARSTEYVLKEFRLANGNKSTNQTITIDNIVGYKGSSPRSIQSLAAASGGERFEFYASYAIDPNKDPVYRSTAYMMASALYETYKNAELYRDLAASFAALDYDAEIFGAAREGCMIQFAELIKRLNSSAITTLNISAKTKEIGKVDEYLNAHLTFYDQSNPEFVALKGELNTAKKNIVKIQNLQGFIDAISKFKRATSYEALKRHMELAQSYYELCDFDTPGSYDEIAADVSVVNLEDSLGMTLIEYYDGMEARVLKNRKTENSIRILSCVDLIVNADYEGGATYEATLEFWEANYDYINKYVLVIRKIVSSGIYDPSYAGVSAAVELYNEMDSYFYELLQRRHVEVMGAQLDRYLLTDSYIEKLGICTYVRNYIDTNDVDESRSDIYPLLLSLQVYEGEVENHRETYSGILEENTEYFIGVVNKMLAYNDYRTLKALYEDAQKYYYGMNIDSEEAKTAIAIYDNYEEMLGEMEYYADVFTGYATKLANATTRAKKHQYLSECSKYRGYLDTTMDEVKLYINYYDNALASYNESVDIANRETESLDSIACATRVLSIPAVVLAVIKNIFS